MKALISVAIVLSLGIPSVGLAAAKAKTVMEDGAKEYPPNNGNVCVLSGPPPIDLQYEVLARIVATKRTYGSVDELFEPIVREARMIGADAVINLQVGQRFKGPLPWRLTSPTGDGQAVKVIPDSPSLDCLGVGGKLWGPSGPITANSVQSAPREKSEQAKPTQASPIVTADPEAEATGIDAPDADLYKDLLKLDDLRQRGILTDAEFQAEKKKLLDRD